MLPPMLPVHTLDILDQVTPPDSDHPKPSLGDNWRLGLIVRGVFLKTSVVVDLPVSINVWTHAPYPRHKEQQQYCTSQEHLLQLQEQLIIN